MYKEIHPITANIREISQNRMKPQSERRPEAELYRQGDTVILKLDLIEQMNPFRAYDGSAEYVTLELTGEKKYTVSVQEGEEIKKLLLKGSGSANADIARELEALTSAVRDLWNLLRARMR